MTSVSVVIPSYKRASSIRESVLSVLDQSFSDLEVIVVDDGSHDGTERVVSAISDSRVKYSAHPKNRGGNAARNTGIRNASGQFIAFLDSDDTWESEKLEKQIAQLDRMGEGYGFCTTWIRRCDPTGKELGRIEPDYSGNLSELLWEGNTLGGFSALVVRREILDNHGELDESLASCQDWDCYLTLAGLTRWTVVPEHLVRYVDNPADDFRISSRRSSVLSGTRHIFDRFLEHVDELPDDVARRSLEHFLDLFAWAGSVPDYARVLGAVPRGLWDSGLRRSAWRNSRHCVRQHMRAIEFQFPRVANSGAALAAHARRNG